MQGDTKLATTPEFRITRLFKVPRQRVWDAWTRPELWAQWFGPKGSRATILSFDLRPGGAIHSRLEGPDGSQLWAKFTYREVEPLRRLSWEHCFSDSAGNIIPAPIFAVWPLTLLTVVTFAEEASGTLVTLTWTPLDATPEEEAAFRDAMGGMTVGWTGSFEQLDMVLADAG